MKKNYQILSYLNMRALFLGVGLSNILSDTKEYLIISLLLGTFIGLVLLKIIKNNNQNKYFNIIANSIIFIAGFLILINMISTMYLTQMPRIIIAIPIILVILYITNNKKIILYRVSNILLFINLSLYVIAFITLFKYLNIDNFYYTNTPIYNIFIGSIKYALYSITPVLLSRKKDVVKYDLTHTYLISSLTMGLIMFMTYSILGPYLSSIYRYPEYIILKNISIGSFIENIENIISFMWIIDAIILLSTCSFNIKEYISFKYLNLYLILLTIVSVFIGKYYILLLGLYKYLHIALLIILIGLCFHFKADKT